MISQLLSRFKEKKLILEEYPPHYKRYKEKFPDLEKSQPLFAWKNQIYNPFKAKITPDLIVHEKVHFKQQGNYPEEWLDKYLEDPQFRLEQEVEAYSAQYKYCKELLPAKWSRKFLEGFARSLSGTLYNNMLSYGEAESKIRNAKNEKKEN